MFVGDSLNRGQWISMLCMLQSAIPAEKQSITPNAELTILTAEVNSIFKLLPIILRGEMLICYQEISAFVKHLNTHQNSSELHCDCVLYRIIMRLLSSFGHLFLLNLILMTWLTTGWMNEYYVPMEFLGTHHSGSMLIYLSSIHICGGDRALLSYRKY